MSTARFNTLQNAAGSKSVPVDTVVDGSAKAWVNFNGTGTVAIRASFNVSSITDNGAGDYTVNFTTAFADANYCASGTHEADSSGDGRYIFAGAFGGKLAASYRLECTATSATQVDTANVCVAFFR